MEIYLLQSAVLTNDFEFTKDTNTRSCESRQVIKNNSICTSQEKTHQKYKKKESHQS